MKAKILCTVCAVMCLVCSGAEASVVNGPVRLGVMRFLSRSEGVNEEQAAAIGDIFSRMLAGSKTITVVERDQLDKIAEEHKMSAAGMITDDTAVRIGKITGCNYMLIGAVTKYEQSSSETDLWLFAQRKYYASATVDARIVDVETTQIVLSLSETGTTTQKGQEVNLPYIGLNTRESMRQKMILKGIEEGAIADAISRLAFSIRENLTGEQIQVLSPGNEEIVIDLGEKGGARVGSLFRVYAEGREIFGADGKSLGRERKNIAVVKITQLQPEFSNAALAQKGAGRMALIHKQDKLIPISKSEMEQLIKNKGFSDKRPR